jgi:hypothetical protein
VPSIINRPALGLLLGRAAAAGARELPRGAKNFMTIGTILLFVLIVMLLGALPTWPHSRSWGYYPSGGLGFVFVVLLVLVLTNRL